MNPFLSKVIASHGPTTVLLNQLGVLFGRFLRIERRRNAAANVDDDALGLPVSDGECVMIVTTAARIDESLIENMRLRRQLYGPAVVDGGFDRRLVNERRYVSAKFRVQLRQRALRIGCSLCRNHFGREQRIERRTCTLQHQHIVIVVAIMIAPLLMQ